MCEQKPTLASLKGIAPDITDGKDAVTYLHELRGGQPLVDAKKRIAKLEKENRTLDLAVELARDRLDRADYELRIYKRAERLSHSDGWPLAQARADIAAETREEAERGQTNKEESQ